MAVFLAGQCLHGVSGTASLIMLSTMNIESFEHIESVSEVQPRAWLTVAGRNNIPITGSEMTIGKGESNDVVIPDEDLNLQHAVISYEHRVYWITNVDGCGEIWVDGWPVENAKPLGVWGGRNIRIGNTDLGFHTELTRLACGFTGRR